MRVSDYFKTHKISDKAMVKHLKILKFVPDYFKLQ